MNPTAVLASLAMAAAALVAIIALSAALRALIGPGPKPLAAPLPELALEAAAGVEAELSALVRHPTVSFFDHGRMDRGAFAAFREDLARLYPLAHSRLDRHEIGEWGLVYEWKGRDPSLRPMMLCSHFDVVGAPDAAGWERGPFSGDLADGYVWGRGTQDVKLTIAASLHAAEGLLARGFSPRRGVILAFGGDEETGGLHGAAAIAQWLTARGVKASFLLDEGGFIAEGMLDFVDRPIALVGVSEKGYIDVAIRATGAGGHSSMPPRRTAAGDLARAVAAIEARPFPTRLCPSVRGFLARVAPYSPFTRRLLFRNLWIAGALAKAVFSGNPTTNALLRTTAAPTMLTGSPAENVLAERATAVVNVRVLPGETCRGALRRLSRIVSRFGCEAGFAHEGISVDPMPESSFDSEGWKAIEAATAAVFPDAVCVPFLLAGGTDTKHYRAVADDIYRMTPVRVDPASLGRIHGKDERIAIETLRECALFYEKLISSV